MPTIWLVDDDEVDGLLFVRAIEAVGDGVEVVVMESADACLSRLDAGERAELIVLDWHLPPAGGLALLAALGERSGMPPAVVLSGSTMPDARQSALDCGARAWVVKPDRPDDMRDALAQMLQDYL